MQWALVIVITICTGWTTRHDPPVVLKPEDGLPPHAVSHGMCSACAEAMLADDDREQQERALTDFQD